MRNKILLLIFLVLYCSLSPAAQESSVPSGEMETAIEDGGEVKYIVVEIPRKMAVFFVPEGNFTASEKLLLSESLLIKLAEDPDIMLLEPLIEEPVASGKRNAAATARGADCWLSLKLVAAEETILITASSYDIHLDKSAFDEIIINKSRDLRGITRRFWQNIIDEVEDGYEVIVERKRYTENLHVISTEEKTILEKGVDVTFIAAPGTLIEGLGEEVLSVGEEGRVTTDLLGYSTYDLRASCRGFYPAEKQIYVENTAKEVLIQQMPASRWGVDVYLQNIDYIGLGVFYYIFPNEWFVELSATFYQQKLIWPVEENGALYNLPLTHLFLTSGYYLNPADSFFRFYGSLGPFARITYLKPVGLTLDPLSPLGLKASINCELLTHLKIKFFTEYSCLLYFTPDGTMMKAALLGVNDSDDMTAGYIFTEKMVFDLLHFKIGGRIQLP